MTSEMQANIAAFEQTLRSTIALGEAFSPEDWKRPTDCPGWSVQDVAAHLVGTELLLLGEDPAAGHVMAEEPPHVRNDLGRLVEPGVDARRGRPGADVLAELRDVLDRRLAALGETDSEQPTVAPTGRMVPYREFMVFRAFDCYIHEHDIRRAVGRPGNLDAPAAFCARTIMESGLPMIVGKRSGAGTNRTVVFEVSEPVPFTSRIRIGEDGRARPDSGSGAVSVSGDVADVTLRMDWETFMRLAAGRCAPTDVKVGIDGDADLAGRILANMVLTP
ncbi:maleylpyruvate isomerase family mycothiol-dependent enzyme [Actinomadura sp. 9N407]|uniref:maleylpyruvate isomerase family mycothiol-dependent enzyme n=1 Tax=Actinomadura sp. 9N407 TaxID=3375154 RepID=UPI0037AF228A